MNPARCASLLPLFLALASASRGAPQDPPDAELLRLQREVRAIRSAHSVAVARVVRVHPSPGVWCGPVVTRQHVTYRVERVLDGEAVTGDIAVGHLLVANSPLVAEHAPFLRPDRVFPGARALLCLNRDEAGGFVVLDEDCGARLLGEPRTPDPRQTSVVQLVLDLPALRPYLHLEREERRPVRVRLDGIVPLPLPVTAGGARVEFLPPELLRDDAHVAFTELSFAGDKAIAKFTLAAEGVVGELVAVQSPGGLVVASSDVHER